MRRRERSVFMAEVIDRPGLKAGMRELLRGAQVNPKGFAAAYLLLGVTLSMVDNVANGGGAVSYGNPLGIFVNILTSLLSNVLAVGFLLYCMSIRQGLRAEYLTLFDGFSFAGKVIGLAVVQTFFILLWSLLFLIPGIVAAYRYRFAFLNLCENPELGCMDALELSKRQTLGYKSQVFMLDLSYLGWELLASLPLAAWTSYISVRSSLRLTGFTGYAPAALGTSLGVDLVCGLWAVAVQIFYLPVYQCTEIGYYEIAKRTSGAFPRADSDWESGDGEDGGLF